MRRAAFYLRVSTEEQTTANQLPELRRIAKVRGLRVVRTFTETESAAKRRPQFDAMLTAAHAGEFDVLIVWALDRFGRSAMGNLQVILDLDVKGVRVVSARESWLETDGPVRTLLIYILSWVAEQERSRLIERTRAGMDRARAQGKHVGRPLAHVNVTMARALLEGGASQAEIAKKLNVSTSSVSRALKRASVAKGGAPREAPKVPKSQKRNRP